MKKRHFSRKLLEKPLKAVQACKLHTDSDDGDEIGWKLAACLIWALIFTIWAYDLGRVFTYWAQLPFLIWAITILSPFHLSN